MKKLLLTIVSAFLFSIQMEAMSLVPLTVSIIDNKPVGHPTPKSPVEPPTVYIEDCVLTFMEDHPDYTLCSPEPSFTFACWNLSRSKCEGSLKRTGNFLGCAP